MKKQDAIEKAYGQHWETVKDIVDENGFIWQSTLFFPETKMMDEIEIQVKAFPPDGRCKWRPVALKGIENNNGWNKIGDINDLPNIKNDLIIFRNKSGHTTTWESDDIMEAPNYYLRYSYWRIKDKVLEPIY